MLNENPNTADRIKASDVLPGSGSNDLSASVVTSRNLEGFVADSLLEYDRAGSRSSVKLLHLLTAALVATANAIVITDRQGTILWTNPAYTELTGYTPNEVIGHTWSMLRSGKDSPEAPAKMWDAILSHEVWSGEATNQRKDGSVYIEDMTITPIRIDNDEELCFVAVKQDVTDRRLMENQFRQAQKMEAVGQLAGGIAHDFNNLLGVIGGCAEALADQSRNDMSVPWIAEEIRNAVKLAATLTAQLLAFARKQVFQPKVVSLNHIVSETVTMLRRVVGEDITFSVNLDPDAGNIRADAGQVQQVIMNLAINARDAMPKGGVITITTANTDFDRDCVQRDTLVRAGHYVKLTLRDTGVGMDSETQRRAFEPFFTTKGPGRGTGLGLAAVYGIVKQSGGYVSLTNDLQKGAVAEVYLVRVEERPEAKTVTALPSKRESGHETVLLVEDYLSLRNMVRASLEKNGYKVITAASGEEGLEVAELFSEPIHLLITDVIMSGMDGHQLAGRMAKQRPSVSVLYMSGHTKERLGELGVLDSQTAFIKKPFDTADLLSKVREALESSTRAHQRSEPPAA
ncbi:MAG: PAS domain S-box protein [Candidatus Sulfotelmatobacter sp.]